MTKLTLLVFLIGIVLVADGQERNACISITEPKDNSSVPECPIAEGVVDDANAGVWVIVHPMQVSDYWVQPRPTVKNNGKWKTMIHIGRPGSVDLGKKFEIMAIADPEEELYEGKILKYWPKARCRSEVIEVTRS